MRKHVEISFEDKFMRGYHDDGNSKKLAIITHGIGGNKLGHKFIFKQFADNCLKNSISCLRLDFVGTGESDGLFDDTKHSQQANQLEQIIKYAEEVLGYKQIYLCSTTIGCYSVWHSAKSSTNIKAIINWNPITNFDRYEASHKKHINSDGSSDLKGLFLNPSYTTDLENLERTIPIQNIPVLLLQGELDNQTKYGEAEQVAIDKGWSYKQIAGGNHLWEGNQVRVELFKETIEFILKH